MDADYAALYFEPYSWLHIASFLLYPFYPSFNVILFCPSLLQIISRKKL